MLITVDDIKNILQKYDIKITGVLHIGAHECEEIDVYAELGVSPNDIVWIDAMYRSITIAKMRGIPNVYTAIITDKDDLEVDFNVSNNMASSSILELHTHKIAHPDIFYIDTFSEKSITVDSFFKTHNLDGSKYNFWNIDIQGAELLALKGGSASLKDVDVLYLEVNEQELYKDCGLIGDIDEFVGRFGFIREMTFMTDSGWGDAIYIKKHK